MTCGGVAGVTASADGSWIFQSQSDTDAGLSYRGELRPSDADAPASPATDHTPRELELRACEGLPEGLAIVDAPDVDSVVEDNRDLAATLLAGADLWIFVTTPARYADQLVWNFLNDAASRGIEVVRALVADGVRARLVIAGDGAMADELVAAGWAADDVTAGEAGSEFATTTVFYSDVADESAARGLAQAIGGGGGTGGDATGSASASGGRCYRFRCM